VVECSYFDLKAWRQKSLAKTKYNLVSLKSFIQIWIEKVTWIYEKVISMKYKRKIYIYFFCYNNELLYVIEKAQLVYLIEIKKI
jgi:hypothetical protein